MFTRNDGRKPNNTSFECPNPWVQHTRRTALLRSQGLPRNLSFKKCTFQEKGCVTAPEIATQLYLTYFVANIQGYKMRHHLFTQLECFSLKSTQIESGESGGRTKLQHSVYYLNFLIQTYLLLPTNIFIEWPTCRFISCVQKKEFQGILFCICTTCTINLQMIT